MIDEQTVDMVLDAKLNPLSSNGDLGDKYIARRIGTTRSTAGVNEMIKQCGHTPGTWVWGDYSVTVFDIREK